MDTNQRLAKIIIKLAKKKQQLFHSSTLVLSGQIHLENSKILITSHRLPFDQSRAFDYDCPSFFLQDLIK